MWNGELLQHYNTVHQYEDSCVDTAKSHQAATKPCISTSPSLPYMNVMNPTFVDVSAHPESAYLVISGTTAEIVTQQTCFLIFMILSVTENLVYITEYMKYCHSDVLFVASSSEASHDKQFLKQLFFSVKEAIEKLPGWPDISPLLIVDDVSILTSLGCKEYDVSVFFQYLRVTVCPHGGTIVSLIHTECNDTQAEYRPGSLYRHIGHQSDIILLVRPLKTGYCRDLSGEVSILLSSAFIFYLTDSILKFLE